MILTTFLFCNAVTGILSVIVAKKRKRSLRFWFLLTLPLGVAALFLLLAIPSTPSALPHTDGIEKA